MPGPDFLDPKQLNSTLASLLDEHLGDLAREGASAEMCSAVRADAKKLYDILTSNGEVSFLAYGLVGLAMQQVIESNV